MSSINSSNSSSEYPIGPSSEYPIGPEEESPIGPKTPLASQAAGQRVQLAVAGSLKENAKNARVVNVSLLRLPTASDLRTIYEAQQCFKKLSDVKSCQGEEEAVNKLKIDCSSRYIWEDPQKIGHYCAVSRGMVYQSFGPKEFIAFMKAERQAEIQISNELLEAEGLTREILAKNLYANSSSIRKCGNVNNANAHLNRFPSLKFVIWESSQKGCFSVLERSKEKADRYNVDEFNTFMIKNDLTTE